MRRSWQGLDAPVVVVGEDDEGFADVAEGGAAVARTGGEDDGFAAGGEGHGFVAGVAAEYALRLEQGGHVAETV